MDEVKVSVEPCAACGTNEKVKFKHEVTYGHGDCTWEGSISCSCGLAIRGLGNWGQPSPEDVKKGFKLWNERMKSIKRNSLKDE